MGEEEGEEDMGEEEGEEHSIPQGLRMWRKSMKTKGQRSCTARVEFFIARAHEKEECVTVETSMHCMHYK